MFLTLCLKEHIVYLKLNLMFVINNMEVIQNFASKTSVLPRRNVAVKPPVWS